MDEENCKDIAYAQSRFIDWCASEGMIYFDLDLDKPANAKA